MPDSFQAPAEMDSVAGGAAFPSTRMGGQEITQSAVSSPSRYFYREARVSQIERTK